jgi:hypothetical protein
MSWLDDIKKQQAAQSKASEEASQLALEKEEAAWSAFKRTRKEITYVENLLKDVGEVLFGKNPNSFFSTPAEMKFQVIYSSRKRVGGEAESWSLSRWVKPVLQVGIAERSRFVPSGFHVVAFQRITRTMGADDSFECIFNETISEISQEPLRVVLRSALKTLMEKKWTVGEFDQK